MHNQSRTAALILGSLSWRLDGSNDSADLCHDDERAQIVAAWERKTARDNRRAQIRRTIDVVSFAIGFAGVCAILYARAMGRL